MNPRYTDYDSVSIEAGDFVMHFREYFMEVDKNTFESEKEYMEHLAKLLPAYFQMLKFYGELNLQYNLFKEESNA